MFGLIGQFVFGKLEGWKIVMNFERFGSYSVKHCFEEAVEVFVG
jgi:hypothetical protein